MTEELKKEILNILDNVYYWETCPQEYNDRIDAVKKQLTLTDVVGRSEQFYCDQEKTIKRCKNQCMRCNKFWKPKKQ
tara:strand:- start:56 stop:286 length:231 start_codon:yes stop_codon:yes gene_type:complete